jgi:dolichol-phosphate mannosyltransferase
VVVVTDPRASGEISQGAEEGIRRLVAERRGLVAAVVQGLREARGDLLVILDAERGYTAEDVARMIKPLEQREAELVVARRWDGPWGPGLSPRNRLGAALGTLTKPLTGVADPFSGLIALSRETARAAERTLTPVGSWFAVELLTKTKGRRGEVSVRTDPPRRRTELGWDELRYFKRLSDERFGNASRLVQFCVVGASGMVIDLTCYALFQLLFAPTWMSRTTAPVIGGPLDLAAARALAIAIALTWNFSLNRRLTFNDARHGSTILRQFAAYALSNALGIALNFTLGVVLPRQFLFFNRHKLAAAVVGIVAATGISFSLSRWVVFRRSNAPSPRTDTPIAEPAAVAEGV